MISTVFLKVLKVLVNFFEMMAHFISLLFFASVPGWQFDALGNLLFFAALLLSHVFLLGDDLCVPRVHFHGCYGHF